jgi:hypothetical protein
LLLLLLSLRRDTSWTGDTSWTWSGH